MRLSSLILLQITSVGALQVKQVHDSTESTPVASNLEDVTLEDREDILYFLEQEASNRSIEVFEPSESLKASWKSQARANWRNARKSSSKQLPQFTDADAEEGEMNAFSEGCVKDIRSKKCGRTICKENTECVDPWPTEKNCLKAYEIPQYRIGDLFYKNYQTADNVRWTNFYFPQSIAAKYLMEKKLEREDYGALIKVMDSPYYKDFERPDADEVVVHVRAYDVLSPDVMAVGYTRGSKYFRDMAKKSKDMGFKKVTILTGDHMILQYEALGMKNKNNPKTLKETKRMLEDIKQEFVSAGLTVKVRENFNADCDLVYMTSAHHFVPSGGSFDKLISQVVKIKKGDAAIVHGENHVRNFNAEFQDITSVPVAKQEPVLLQVYSQTFSTTIRRASCKEIKAELTDKSLIGKFKIDLCLDEGLQPKGRFRIQKLKGCGRNKTRISMSETTNTAARELGEDEFLLSLEGPEVRPLVSLPLNSTDQDHCVYNLPFALTIPGKYHVNLAWFQEGYESVRESGDFMARQTHLDRPLGDELYLDFGNLQATATALRSVKAQSNLPACDLHKLNEGRWVFKGNPNDIFGSKYSQTHAERPKVDYSMYEWFADDCQQVHFTKAQAGACMKDKKIEFRGGNNMQRLYKDFTNFACHDTPNDEPTMNKTAVEILDQNPMPKLSKMPKTTKPITISTPLAQQCTQTATCGKVCKVNEMGDGPGQLQADLVVANFGQAIPKERRHTTLNEYTELLNRFATKSEERMSENKNAKIAWMETDFLPFGHYTAPANRMRLYNKAANALFASKGVPIVQSFERTRAFWQHLPTATDYPAQVSSSMVNDILTLAGCTV